MFPKISIQQLEAYLDQITKISKQPFALKLTGIVETATVHIVNVPKGTKVSSPVEAPQGQKNFKLTNEQSEIVGFFSTEHKGIFTHHNSFLHMHLMTVNKDKMGHLDEVMFKKGAMKLYLPAK